MIACPRRLALALALALPACGGSPDTSSGDFSSISNTNTSSATTPTSTGDTSTTSTSDPLTTSTSTSTSSSTDTSTGTSTTTGSLTSSTSTTTGDTSTGGTGSTSTSDTGSSSSTGEPVVCPPADPNSPPCKACGETTCCSEYDACQADAKCDCIFDCVFGGNGPMSCAFQCMQVGMNGKPLDDMFLCMINAKCGSCPF
jgi:hypothetical protein